MLSGLYSNIMYILEGINKYTVEGIKYMQPNIYTNSLDFLLLDLHKKDTIKCLDEDEFEIINTVVLFLKECSDYLYTTQNIEDKNNIKIDTDSKQLYDDLITYKNNKYITHKE